MIMIKHITNQVRKSKRILAILFTLSLSQLLTTPVSAQTTDSIKVFSEEHPLVYEDAWDLWPYVFLNENGEPDGYNIDLLRIIFKRLNIPYIVKLKPTLEAQADLKSGKSDLMLRMDASFSRGNSLYSKTIVQLFTHSVVSPLSMNVTLRTGKDLTTTSRPTTT